MRKPWALAVATVALAGCASTMTVTQREPWVDVDRIMRLANERSFAHGCPVGPDRIYTSAHVVARLGLAGKRLIFPARWSNSDGQGRAAVRGHDTTSDLAVLTPTKPLTRWFTVAKSAPQLGAEVLVVGYDWSDPKLPRRVVMTTVTAIEAGHLIYGDSPGDGSSGACVLTRAQEVVAIHYATIHHGRHRWGAGVAVWGDWNPLDEEK